ncbi:hypothetical protein DPMN_037422 [Dreissena polymorpha]|uniref:Uncharacterized protein n=1 Tax=Dreissena polymorpha TaxID=45954 RepID=A0A9D4MDI0_DREPO|nr:hypothetical protein DPMN_037422 [Dreissena polymorpha]
MSKQGYKPQNSAREEIQTLPYAFKECSMDQRGLQDVFTALPGSKLEGTNCTIATQKKGKIYGRLRKNAPPTGSHVFQATGTIFELVQNIIGTNLLTKFHNDHTINMASRLLTRKKATPPGRPHISGTNLLTKFHEDRKINVASRMLTRKHAPSPGGHVF